jgi:hypothetical protein
MLTAILLTVLYSIGFGYAYNDAKNKSKDYIFPDLRSKVDFAIYFFIIFIFSPGFILMDIGGRLNTILNK